jgi:hypothetical protein
VTGPVRPVELIAGVARSGPTDPGGPKPGDDTEGAGEEPLLRPSYLFGANIRLYYSEDSGLIPAHERLYPDNNSAIIGTPFKKTVKGFWAPLLWYSPRIPHPLLWAGYGENSNEMHAIVAKLDCRLTRRAVTGHRFASRVS